jgi:hypothetical protein
MAIIDQINARVDPQVKARLDAAAAVLDQTSSVLLREALEAKLEEFEARAEEAAKRRGKWPGAIPQHEVDTALVRVLKSVSRNEPIRLMPGELYGADAKALWVLLSWVWSEGDDSAADTDARKKLAKFLDGLNIRATVADVMVHPRPAPAPDAKPIKSYPRRSGE